MRLTDPPVCLAVQIHSAFSAKLRVTCSCCCEGAQGGLWVSGLRSRLELSVVQN